MRLLFLKGKETMKMLKEQNTTWDEEEQVTETLSSTRSRGLQLNE